MIEKELEIKELREKGIKEANLVKKDIYNILRAIAIGFLLMSFLPLILIYI